MKFDAHEWLKEKKIYRDDYMRKMDLIQEKIKNRIVLDAGCGKGYKTNYFSKFANKIYGIEIDNKNIQKARKLYSEQNLIFIMGNIEKIPFRDSSLDIMYACWVIEHLKNPRKFIGEAYRVLKPEGILILWVPNIKSILGILTKMASMSIPIKILGWLKRKMNKNIEHYKCCYRANSVKRLDRLATNKFKKRYLEQFDSPPDIFRYHKIIFFSWFLIHRLLYKSILAWSFSSFYIEFISLKDKGTNDSNLV